MFSHYNRMTFDGPVYCGFFADERFIDILQKLNGVTALPVECLWPIYRLAKQSLLLSGEFIECGVDKGGSARLLADVVHGSGKRLHLFDTFAGMPETDLMLDVHQAGDFPPPGIDKVREFVGFDGEVEFHPGVIPATFSGLEQMQVAFAHVDCDIHSATLACCEFIYPRLPLGGVMVFDDYGRPTCPGVRKAVDDYFEDKRSIPMPIVASGQAIVFKI